MKKQPVKRKKRTKKTPETHQKNGNRKGYRSPSQRSADLLKTPKSKIAGRPSQYPNVSKKHVFQYYLLGLTDEEVGALLDPPVSRETILSWKIQFPEFLSTIKQAKELMDAKIVAAMANRALGSKLPAAKFFLTRDGKIKTKKYIEHYPPDVQAGQFLLRNRQPKLFNDKHDEDPNTSSPIVNVNVITDPATLLKLQQDREERTKTKKEDEQD